MVLLKVHISFHDDEGIQSRYFLTGHVERHSKQIEQEALLLRVVQLVLHKRAEQDHGRESGLGIRVGVKKDWNRVKVGDKKFRST